MTVLQRELVELRRTESAERGHSQQHWGCRHRRPVETTKLAAGEEARASDFLKRPNVTPRARSAAGKEPRGAEHGGQAVDHEHGHGVARLVEAAP